MRSTHEGTGRTSMLGTDPAIRTAMAALVAVAWDGAGDECTATVEHDQPSLSG